MTEKTILIIDDDQHLLLGLTARLKAKGYRVICAADAISAITVARKEVPDLIILDLGLPAGDGFAVLKNLQDYPALSVIPVIVLTARDPEGNKRRTLESGAVAFFQKPADNGDLLEEIRARLQIVWGWRGLPS